jgi:hypothetical protein
MVYGDDISVFDETVNFNINTKYDACAYSVLTPYPGNLTRYEMKKANGIVSFDWEKYDQDHVVFRQAQMTGDELRLGQSRTYETFYSLASIASRFPTRGPLHRTQWLIYNTFMRRASKTDSKRIVSIAAPTEVPDTAPNASYLASQTRMACGRARGSRRTGTTHELKCIDNPYHMAVPCRPGVTVGTAVRRDVVWPAK